MNEGRKVDKSLFKDILRDVALATGEDPNMVDDTYVDDTWKSTGANLTKLLQNISMATGGSVEDVTPDVIEDIKDKYRVVDPNYTFSTLSTFSKKQQEEYFLPENPDERQRFRLETSFGAIDDYYKKEGSLTPRQKETLFYDRYKRREAALENMPTDQKHNNLYEYAKELANDIGMVYDPTMKTYVVPKEEHEKYNLLFAGTYLDPNELPSLNVRLEDIENDNKQVANVADKIKKDREIERMKNPVIGEEKPVTSSLQMEPVGLAGNIPIGQYERLYENAASLLSEETDKSIALTRKLMDGGTARHTWEGIKEGVVEHFTNVTKLMEELGKQDRVVGINRKLKNIHEEVLTEHPELRYRDRPLYSNGELLPPDDEESVRIKQEKINEEVNRRAKEQLSEDEMNVLDAYSLNVQALDMLNKETGRAFNIGNMMGGSLGFMTEFALTGGIAGGIRSVGTSLAKKGLTKVTSTAIAKGLSNTAFLKGMAEVGGKVASSKIGNVSGKVVNWAAKNMTDAALQTIIQPTLFANVSKDISKGATAKEAFVNNFQDLMIENFTERMFVPSADKAAKATAASSNVFKKALNEFMYRGGNAAWGERGIVKLGLSWVEESAEEKVGDLIRGAITAIDRGEANYFTEQIVKPEDVDMLMVTGLMTGALGGLNIIAAPASKSKLSYQVNKYSKLLPSELRDKIDELMTEGRLSDRLSSARISGEINAAVEGLYDNNTEGGLKNKKRKELVKNAMNYVHKASALKNMEAIEESEEGLNDENFQFEGEKFTLDGKEVVATATEVEEEGKIEVEDADGNRTVVDYDTLVPVEEVETVEDTGTGETITEVEQQKTEENAEETRGVREESQSTEQGERQEGTSEPVGGVPEVNGVESTQGETEIEQPKKRMNEGASSGIVSSPKEDLGELKKSVQHIAKQIYQLGRTEQRHQTKARLKEMRDLIRGKEKLFTPKQFKKLMTQLSKSFSSEKSFRKLLSSIEQTIAEQEQVLVAEQRNKIIDKARKKLNSAKRGLEVKDRNMLNDFLNLDPAKMSVEDRAMFYDIASDISEGRYSELTKELMDEYFTPEESKEEKKWTVDKVKDYLNKLNDRITSMGSAIDIASFEDLNRYLRSINNIRSKAVKLYNDGKITEMEIETINDMIDTFMEGDAENGGFLKLSQDARENVTTITELELEDAIRLHPYNLVNPTSVDVNDIANNMDAVDKLTEAQLVTLYNGLYNLNNGFATRELSLGMSYLKEANMRDAFATKIRPAIEKASRRDSKFAKYRDDHKKLIKDLQMRDLNTAEYLLWTAEGTPIYDNIVAGYVEPATVAAHAAQAELLADWVKVRLEFEKEYNLRSFDKTINKTLGISNKGQNLMNLAGVLMLEQDYQTNQLGGKRAGVATDKRSYFLHFVNNSVINSRSERRKYNNVSKYLKFDDGFVDVKATLQALPAKDRANVQNLIDAARKTFDGKLRDYNIANTRNRGYDTKFYDSDYFPRMVLGEKGDIPVIQTLQEMSEANWGGKLAAPSAIKSRVGGISKVEIDLGRVVTSSIEEATMEFHVTRAYNSVVKSFNAEKKLPSTSTDMKNVLQAFAGSIKDRIVSVYHLDKLHNNGYNVWNMVNKYINGAARVNLLVNPAKMLSETVTNWMGAVLSDGITVNPVEAIRNVQQARAMRDMYAYYKVVETSSMTRYSEISREAYGRQKTANEKMIDSWIRLPDILTSSNVYIQNFNKEFKDITGTELNIDSWEADDAYKRSIDRAFRTAHLKAIKQAQISFSTIAPVSQATHTRLLPWIRPSNINRDNVFGRYLGFMMSFAIKETEMIKIGIDKMYTGAKDGNMNLFYDGLRLLTSRFVRSMGYSVIKPVIQTAIASAWAGDDDGWDDMDDKILKMGSINFAGLLFGRYGNIAQLFHSVALFGCRLAEQNDWIDTDMYDKIKEFSGYATYARPMNPYKVDVLELFKEIFPAMGLFVDSVYDASTGVYEIARKLEKKEKLSVKDEESLRTMASFFQLMTFIIPNIFTANVRTLALDGANYTRRSEANKDRERKTNKALGSTNVKWLK